MSDLPDSCTVKYTYSQVHVRLLISCFVAFPSSLVYSLFNRVQQSKKLYVFIPQNVHQFFVRIHPLSSTRRRTLCVYIR